MSLGGSTGVPDFQSTIVAGRDEPPAVGREGDGEHGQPVDTGRVMVGARLRGHLEALQTRFPEQLGQVEISGTPGADYPWRLFCVKGVWADCVKALVLDTAYDNFKDICARRHGSPSDYLEALHRTWELLANLEGPEQLGVGE